MKNSQKVSVTILVVLVVVILVAGAYFAGKQSSQVVQMPEISPTVTIDKTIIISTPVPTPVATPIAVAKVNKISKPITPAITLLSPKNGDTVKMGNLYLIQWKMNGTLQSSYKFIVNAGTGDKELDANQTSTAYSLNYLINNYRVTGDTLSDVAPGQYKITVSLYDGIAPVDSNGLTCAKKAHIYCNNDDLYGKLITQTVSENYLTITK